jgi:hypothetical protein
MRELEYLLSANALNASENHRKICRTEPAP